MNNMVTSFWAIDSGQPAIQQRNDAAAGGSGLNWEYATAHTASRGEKVALDNQAGTLGPLQMGVQCNLSGASRVACCRWRTGEPRASSPPRRARELSVER